MTKSYFDYRVDADGVATITFDAPDESVNTVSIESGNQFRELMEKAQADAAVKAIVFISGKKDNFVAGADIKLIQSFHSREVAEELTKKAQESFDILEGLGKPVVAAIHGSCLGGGLEWALACRYRVATDHPKTSLGLPEVQLGLMPAAGGTQRLPRLIGVQAALDLILAGKTVKASKARKLGMVDELVPPPILLDVAKRRALELASGSLRIDRTGRRSRPDKRARGFGEVLKGIANKERWAEFALEENPIGRKVLFDQARKMLLKKTRGKYPGPEKALEAIRIGAESGMKKGLEAESRFFADLATSDVSRRLIEIFFATTELKKDNGTSNPKVKAREVKKLGVLGGGLMGGGIAYVTLQQMGVPVRVRDKDDAGVIRALKQVRGIFDERVKRRSMTSRDVDAKMGLLTLTTDYSGFKSVDLVIEAVFEDLAVKHNVIREVEAVTRPDCIFASNTSSLPITKLAEASKRPETIIGMHYFSPVNKMPLLEIIVHKGTADWVTATCVEVGKKQGKTVIVVNDGVGFYTSRALAPFANEAAYLLAEGADIAELDRSLVDFGFPVGPITLLDEVGIDVAAKVAKIMHEAFGARIKPPDPLAAVIADGRAGRKNKKGFYTYDGKKKQVDESVYLLLPHGKDRKRLDRAEMAERCALQFVNEAIRCLGEGVLRSPRDGDIGAIFGLGFPPFLGGPLRYADALGPEKLLARLEHYHQRLGERFEPAPYLRDVVKAGKKFYA